MASSGVNVKMGVSGVAQFKQSLNQAKQAVKTLDAQLALNEKQFKQTGDAESYMTMKAELLKSKMEQQKAAIESSEKALQEMQKNGVDRASKAYQDLYRQMLQAKGELIDTQNVMNGVAEAGDSAASGVDEMNNQLKRVGDGVSWQNVTTGLGKVTDGLANAAKKALNLGRKIADAMLGAGSYADDLKTRASVYGLSVEDLQRMDKTANLIDTSVESIVSSQKKLKKGIGSADKGVMGAFAELLGKGYNPQKKGFEQAFWDAGEAIQKFTNEEEKEVYAQRLFGRSWNELIPLFEAGREEYEKTNASWKVLSEDQINDLAKIDDEYQKLQANVEELKLELLSNFAEPFSQLMVTINEQVDKISEWVASPEGKAAIQQFVDAVKGGFEWVTQHSGEIVTALGAIAGGFALLKMGEFAMSVGQAVAGLRNLLHLGGDKGTSPSPTGGTGTGTGVGTGVGVTATKAATMASKFLVNSGMILPVVGDRVMNETNAGRALRDGGDVLEGLQKDVEEFTTSVEKNAETFEEDWKNNGIYKVLEQAGKEWRLNGQNTMDYWFGDNGIFAKMKEAEEYAEEHKEDIPDVPKSTPSDEWVYGDDWSIDEIMDDLSGKMDKMAEATEGMTGANENQTRSNSEMTQAVQTMNSMPAQLGYAMGVSIRNALAGVGITIDGDILVGYVNTRQATEVGP